MIALSWTLLSVFAFGIAAAMIEKDKDKIEAAHVLSRVIVGTLGIALAITVIVSTW